MKVLAFVTQKGGAGKSTLAASVAVAAAQAGERVRGYDLDPQGSFAGWGGRRTSEPDVEATNGRRLPDLLRKAERQGITLALIDTAGFDAPGNEPVMRACDLALIPARPTVLDLEGARPTIRALAALKRDYAFVLSQCPPRLQNARTVGVGDALGAQAPVAGPPIVLRAHHQDAFALGLGVTEYAPTGKASEEIRALWTWIAARLARPALSRTG